MSRRTISLALVVGVVLGAAPGHAGTASAARGLEPIREAIAARGARWRAARTPFTDLTPEQMAAYLGADVNAAPAEPLAEAPVQALGLPSSLDWRRKGGDYVSPVRHQYRCGSCWAFAAAAVLESKVLITAHKPGQPVDLAEQVLNSCSGAGGCGGGNIYAASAYLKRVGIPGEAYYPYQAADTACADAEPDSWPKRAYRIGEYYAVSRSVDALRSAIATYGPIMVSMTIYQDFQSYAGGVYEHVWGSAVGGHALVLTGYDDGDRAFTAKNSWGYSWGDSGYARISYDEVDGPLALGAQALAYGDAVLPAGAVGLGPALDAAALPWSTGVGARWFGARRADGAGGDAASSELVSFGQKSWLRTTVRGPADLRYSWSNGTGPPPEFTLAVDGEKIVRHDAEATGWQRVSLPLGPGEHALSWSSTPYWDPGFVLLDRVRVAAPTETLQRPPVPDGPTSGKRGALYRISVPAQATSTGHEVLYRFDWGDGTLSDWTTSPGKDHVWQARGAYRVRVRTRCREHASLTSSWSLPLRLTVAPPANMPLGEAVDNLGPTWESGGDAAWFGQDAVFEADGDAAQSGKAPAGGSSWLQTVIRGPARVSFSWKISSNDNYLFFHVDGQSVGGYLQGTAGWSRGEAVLGPGAHTLRWTYKKLSGSSSGLGNDCGWLDRLVVEPLYERVTNPQPAAGETYFRIDEGQAFTTGQAVSSQGHPVEYLFDWGDGSDSGWSAAASAEHAWATEGGYYVRVRARCAVHPEVATAWAASLHVFAHVPEVVTPPDTPTGPSAGVQNEYLAFRCAGGTSNLTNYFQYQYDWGDGALSDWRQGSSDTKHRWTAPGAYLVRARLRSSYGEQTVSSWSAPREVTIAAAATVDLATALDATGLSWETGGDSAWYGVPRSGAQGGDAGRSGIVEPGQTSWLQTTASGPAYLHFTWEHSEGYLMTVRVLVDGVSQAVMSSIPSQERRTLTLGAGSHVVRWELIRSPGAQPWYEDTVWLDGVLLSDESLTAPGAIAGPTSGNTGETYAFTVGPASSNLGHALEYRFDWGGGDLSPWLSSPAGEHSWTASSTHSLRAQARCAAHPEIVGPWSASRSFTAYLQESVVGPPDPIGGPEEVPGDVLTEFTVGGATSSLGHQMTYFVDWGDGFSSSYVDGPATSHRWLSEGTFQVRVRASCRSHTQIQSDWSPSRGIRVVRTTEIPTPAVVSGPTEALVRQSHQFGAGTVVSALGHAVEYRFKFGSAVTDWSSSPFASFYFPVPVTTEARVQARCAEDPGEITAWSAPWPVSAVLPPEEVVVTGAPTGPAAGFTATSYTYQIGASSSNVGHWRSHQFDWGDGNLSPWVGTSTAYAWSAPGTYPVRYRARCATHGVESAWSEVLPVAIATLPLTASTPHAPLGPERGTSGVPYSFSTRDATCTFDQGVEYRFDWGDGNRSAWSASEAAEHVWDAPGSPQVMAQARCAEGGIESPWSEPATLVLADGRGIPEALETPGAPWETGGDAPWTVAAAGCLNGDCARSGEVGDYQASWISLDVAGAELAGFRWKVSSEEGGDWLVFFLDGVEQERISGEAPWSFRTVPLDGGRHTLLWLYVKDGTGTAGEDAGRVDWVESQRGESAGIAPLSPAAGDTLHRGESPVLLWETSDVVGPVDLVLLRWDGGARRWRSSVIAREVADTGSREWLVPAAQRRGRYRLLVRASLTPAIRGRSGTFQIR